VRILVNILRTASPFTVESTHAINGTAIGIWGRHDLFVGSLAALLLDRGASVQVLEQPTPPAVDGEGSVEVVLLESTIASEVEQGVACGLPVLALMERADSDAALGALALGAHAVLAKNAPLADLSVAIRRALELRPSEPPARLTSRQQEVLKLIADGLDNAQIAQRLKISTRTARAHVSGVLERLGVENRTQAAVTAVRHGWVS
jgi:DNA-binding CsgD family transcriptional regulator